MHFVKWPSVWGFHWPRKCIWHNIEIWHFKRPLWYGVENVSYLLLFRIFYLIEFNVRVNSTYSDIQEQEMGGTQGSILSVTLRQNVSSWEFVCCVKQTSLPLKPDVANFVCSMQLNWRRILQIKHKTVFNPLYVYDKQPNTIQPIGLWVKPHFENSDIHLDDTAPIVIPENPPWLNTKPIFKFEVTHYKTSETNPLLIQQYFAEIKSIASDYSAIYTDGSEEGERVASVAVFGQQVYYVRLPSASSIFSAEANAMPLALKFIASSDKSKFMICSDSLSCLLAI